MPLPSCPTCATPPHFERRPRRAGHAERLACPRCTHATPWLFAGPNGEHRPELLRRWTGVTGPSLDHTRAVVARGRAQSSVAADHA
jgi:hypothetical protein